MNLLNDTVDFPIQLNIQKKIERKTGSNRKQAKEKIILLSRISK